MHFVGEATSIHSFLSLSNTVLCVSTAASAIAIAGGRYGLGAGSINLAGLICFGDEQALANCSSFPSFFSLFFCSHFSDAGVLCPRECVCVCVCVHVFMCMHTCVCIHT